MNKPTDGKMDAEIDRLKRKCRLLEGAECLMRRNSNGINQFVVP